MNRDQTYTIKLYPFQASSEGEDEDGAEEEACPEAESTRINNDSQVMF